jgi:hypothetical protein
MALKDISVAHDMSTPVYVECNAVRVFLFGLVNSQVQFCGIQRHSSNKQTDQMKQAEPITT